MPTYEFACPAGHEFERFFRKMSDAPTEQACPECGRPAVRQLSGGAGLIFKGSGFYITDYGKDGKKREKAQESGGEKKGEEATRSSDTSSGGSSAGAKTESSGADAKPDTSAKKKGSGSAE
jgi:putative FmdB family regulatory protein